MDHIDSDFWFNKSAAISPIASLFTLFVATFGLYLAGKRTQELSRQNDIALDRNRITEQGQATERYARAGEQLGHSDQSVRRRGLDELGRIAEENPEERRQAINQLASFAQSQAEIKYQIDEHGNIKKVKGEAIPEFSKPRSEKIDIETVIKILAEIVKSEERRDKQGRFVIDLSTTDLRDLRLQEQKLQNFNFQGALLSDKNTQISLFGADLTSANLIHANLTSATLFFANLTSANLSYANLTSARLRDASLTFARLLGADLTNADLIRANLTSADMRHANLTSADMRNANLTNAHLYAANLTGAMMRSAKGLTQEQIKDIRYKKGKPPKLPIELVLPRAAYSIIKQGDEDWIDED